MTKISIIIPVYNDSKLLNKSISSILCQSLEDIEIICVDDGSTDNSLEILNNYAKQFEFIKVLSQTNQGPGKARNYGMEHATGDYIGFLDADDFFISNNALEKLYEVAIENNANIVSGNIKLVTENGTYFTFTALDYYTIYDKIPPEEYGIPWAFYKNIYKKEFLIDNHIKFPDLIRGEDPVFLAEVLSLADVIYTVPIDFYAYFYVDGFIKVNDDRKYYDHIMHYKMVFDYLSDSKFDEIVYKFKKEINGFIEYTNIKSVDKVITIIQEIFNDDPKILRQCEEYFYFKYQNNEDLCKLVEFKKDLNNPRISVIMPSNNFVDSIDSIINQTFDDFELICFNNNEISSSYLYNLSKKDSRIIVKNDINSIDDALNIARGDYIYFFNPKGKLSDIAFEELYKNAIRNDSDIVLFKLSKLLPNHEIDYDKPLYNLDELEYFDVSNFDNYSFDYKTILGHIFDNVFVPWSKFYKKEFLNKNEDLKFTDLDNEDIIFNVMAIFKAKHISFSPNYYYTYYNEEYENDYFNKNIINIIDYIEDFLKENNYFEDLEFEFNKFKIYQLSKNIIPSKSEKFYKYVKNIFSEIDEHIIEDLPYHILKKHNWVMYSDTLKEYELKDTIDEDSETFNEFHLKFEIHDLKLMNKKLISKNEKLNKKVKKLTKSNKKLTKDNKSLKSKNKKLNKLNKKVLSSNSWKLTKPLRKIRN